MKFSFVLLVWALFLCIQVHAQSPSAPNGLRISGAPVLVFTQQPPSSVNALQTFSARLEIRTPAGALVTSANNLVRLQLLPNTFGSSLFGTITLQAVGGIVDASGLGITEPGSNLRILAAADGLGSAVSAPITVSPGTNGTIDYDIIYIRYPRDGDINSVYMPDGEHPYSIELGADLALLHPDGSEDILIDCGTQTSPTCTVIDSHGIL